MEEKYSITNILKQERCAGVWKLLRYRSRKSQYKGSKSYRNKRDEDVRLQYRRIGLSLCQ